ncbi:MAG: hypothetical protein P8Y63_04260 [Deltaproteobacteria bacterium]
MKKHVYDYWRRLWTRGKRRQAKTEQIPPDLDKFLEYYDFFAN